MRHIILAALGAIAALPVTVAPRGPDAGLYVFGITAAFSAGMYYSRSQSLEKSLRERLDQFHDLLRNTGRVIEGLSRRFALLRASFEGWRGRVDVTLEAQDRRITALEDRRLEPAA
jgi:hypothetical protein